MLFQATIIPALGEVLRKKRKINSKKNQVNSNHPIKKNVKAQTKAQKTKRIKYKL